MTDGQQQGGQRGGPVGLEPRARGAHQRTICPKGISEDEFALFIEQCKRSGLDPLLKEAFCVGRRQNTGNRERPNWVTRYEFQPSEAGMLARAERFPDFKGIQASAVYAEDEIIVDQGKGEVVHRFNPAKRKGALVGAWARVVREGKLPVVVWLDFSGYVQQTPLWAKIPTTMIEKCARVAALRKALPGGLRRPVRARGDAGRGVRADDTGGGGARAHHGQWHVRGARREAGAGQGVLPSAAHGEGGEAGTAGNGMEARGTGTRGPGGASRRSRPRAEELGARWWPSAPTRGRRPRSSAMRS